MWVVFHVFGVAFFVEVDLYTRVMRGGFLFVHSLYFVYFDKL